MKSFIRKILFHFGVVEIMWPERTSPPSESCRIVVALSRVKTLLMLDGGYSTVARGLGFPKTCGYPFLGQVCGKYLIATNASLLFSIAARSNRPTL
jgi:hypothetical protein